MPNSNKTINNIPVIKKEDTEKFLKEFNSNKVSDEFLASCRKAGKLFEKHKQK